MNHPFAPKAIAAFIMTFALTTSLVFAQGSGKSSTAPNPANAVERKVKFLTTLLGLDSTQQGEATTYFTNAATANKALRTSLQTARQNLQAAVEANNGADITTYASQIGQLQGQAGANNAMAEAQLYTILNQGQQAKLKEFESQRHGMMGGIGPGGFRSGH